MKKLLVSFIAILCSLASIEASYDCLPQIGNITEPVKSYKTDRTFFVPRPLYQNLAVRQQLWYSTINHRQGPAHAVAHALGIYQKSRDTHNLPAYFLFDCLNSLTIRGDDVADYSNRNVRAEWLGLPSSFDGSLVLQPRQEQAGAIIFYNQRLDKFFSVDFFKHAWVEASIPVIRVENSLGFDQDITSTGTTYPGTLSEAFNQPTWEYGHLYTGSQHKTSVAEVRLTLGWEIPVKAEMGLSSYSSFIIPTHRTQEPRDIFSPIVGNNGHVGMATGVRFDIPLHEKESCLKLWLFMQGEAEYFFYNTQKRIFDLKDKPWSRYMQYRREGYEDTVPGVNILTVHSHVHPHLVGEFVAGFKTTYGGFEAEIAYSLWARSGERVRLLPQHCNDCSSPDFIFEDYGIAGTSGMSASTSTINQLGEDDETFVNISFRDINLCTGTFPGGSAQRVHASLGYATCQENRYQVFMGVGGFYEGPRNRNTALKNWGAWANLGLGF